MARHVVESLCLITGVVLRRVDEAAAATRARLRRSPPRAHVSNDAMNLPYRWILIFIVLASGILSGGARAELPAIPDPQAWSSLPAAERDARAGALRERLRAATPDERRQFRERLRERLSALPPEQRREMADRLREDWKAMSDRDRERLRAERRAYIESLSADERRALLRERRELFDRMTPEERRRWQRELGR